MAAASNACTAILLGVAADFADFATAFRQGVYLGRRATQQAPKRRNREGQRGSLKGDSQARQGRLKRSRRNRVEP